MAQGYIQTVMHSEVLSEISMYRFFTSGGQEGPGIMIDWPNGKYNFKM